MLRLANSVVGPVSVARGAAAGAQTIEAYSPDGSSLALSLSSSASWITATAGSPRACTQTTAARTCVPLNFALATAGLAEGIQTGIVTVKAPGVIDAPQTITVTVQVGGGVPASVDAWVAPGSTREVPFATNSIVNTRATTQDGGQWLSVALDGVGSFRFSYPYRIRLTAPAGAAPGAYQGSLAVSGSSFAADNKSIPVTMRVTASPIAQASTEKLEMRVAQGAPAQSAVISISNLGQGTLSVQNVSSTGGAWLTAVAYAGGAALSLDPGTLAQGEYTGSVTISTNAVNALAAIPVVMTVVAKDGPSIYYQGVVDNGTYKAGDPVARGDIMIVKGEQLSLGAFAWGPAPPLATEIGGARVLVNGVAAPMFYSMYGQLAFQMPVDAPIGTALIQVVRDGLTSNTVSVPVVERAPRIVLSGVGDYGVVTFPDYSRPMPVGSFPGVSTHPARAGDTLTIWAIGLGPTDPAVLSGEPAPGAKAGDSLANVTPTPQVNFGRTGGKSVVPFFAGLSPTYAGLYQVNVTVPEGLPKGTVYLTISFSDTVSNAVAIAVE